MEGTRAQLRVLEAKTNVSPEHQIRGGSPSRGNDITLRLGSVSTPSMKAMVPLAMDELLQNSSSTESAHDPTERDKCPETPKRRPPSKIPLPGTTAKGCPAPKPPTGRPPTNYAMTRSTSGPPSSRSLNKSTSSLLGKSESSLLMKKDSPSLNRPESAQSWRRDTSLNGRTVSSIPVSEKTSPAKPSYSPVPKPKRDSLTTRVRGNLDSLTRVHNAVIQHSTMMMQASQLPQNNNLSKLNGSKKDASPSFLNGGNGGTRVGKGTTTMMGGVSVRRASSVSVGGNHRAISNSNGGLQSGGGGGNNNSNSATNDSHQNGTDDNGKVRNIRSSIWNWLKS